MTDGPDDFDRKVGKAWVERLTPSRILIDEGL
jgi:hypothetical protein